MSRLSRRSRTGMPAAAPGRRGRFGFWFGGLPWDPPWSAWQEVPGGQTTVDAPAVFGRGGPWVFVRGPDDRVYYNFLDTFTWVWRGWRAVPVQGRTAGSTVRAPAVVDWDDFQDDFLGLFVQDASNGIQYNLYDYNDDVWKGWRPVPGGMLTPGAPGAAWISGSLYVFVQGLNDGVYYSTLSGSSIDVSNWHWSAWQEVPSAGHPLPGGGQTPSAPSAGSGHSGPTAGPGGINTGSVFVRGTDDGIYENAISGDGTPTWSGWREVPGGGRTYDAPAALGEFYAGARPPVFVRGTDNGVYFNLRYPNFLLFRPLWRRIPGVLTLSAPAATDIPAYKPTYRFVFARGLDDHIYYSYYAL